MRAVSLGSPDRCRDSRWRRWSPRARPAAMASCTVRFEPRIGDAEHRHVDRLRQRSGPARLDRLAPVDLRIVRIDEIDLRRRRARHGRRDDHAVADRALLRRGADQRDATSASAAARAAATCSPPARDSSSEPLTTLDIDVRKLRSRSQPSACRDSDSSAAARARRRRAAGRAWLRTGAAPPRGRGRRPPSRAARRAATIRRPICQEVGSALPSSQLSSTFTETPIAAASASRRIGPTGSSRLRKRRRQPRAMGVAALHVLVDGELDVGVHLALAALGRRRRAEMRREHGGEIGEADALGGLPVELGRRHQAVEPQPVDHGVEPDRGLVRVDALVAALGHDAARTAARSP